MDLESLHDCPDLLADGVRQFEIFQSGARRDRLESATPALAPERLQADVGAAPGRERSEARRLATERTDRVRRRGRGNVQGTVNLPVSAVGGSIAGILRAVPRDPRRWNAPRPGRFLQPASLRAAARACGSFWRGRWRQRRGGP